MPYSYSPTTDTGSDALATLLGVKGRKGFGSQQVPSAEDYQFSGAVPSRGELSSPFEQDVARGAANADAEQHAQAKVVQDWMNQLDPRAQEAENFKNQNQAKLNAVAPTITAQGNLAVENARNAGALALKKQEEQSSANIMQQYAQGQGPAGATNASAFKPAINAAGGVSWSVDKPPQAVEQQQTAAKNGLSLVPQTRQLADMVAKQGLTGPMSGPIHDYAVKKGWSTYFMSPQNEKLFNDYKLQLEGIKTAIASAQGAARAAASPAIRARFDSLLNLTASPSAISGGLDAAERYLTAYSGATTEAEKDAIDNAFANGGGYDVFKQGR